MAFDLPVGNISSDALQVIERRGFFSLVEFPNATFRKNGKSHSPIDL